MSDYLERTNGGRTFIGSDVNIFRLAAIAGGLRFYARTGIPINRAYTPKNLLRIAREETGQTFTGKDKYLRAAAALEAKANAAKDAPRSELGGRLTCNNVL
jgi:hypothetical protein